MGLRRWETYVALLAVILATLSPMADNPRTTLVMALGAVALILLVGVALIRRAKVKQKPLAFDPYERAARIREERERRRYRDRTP
ncbi:MAG: hypothetical protein NVS9B12_03490 [Vulcanimicrobiaceae bacterium]